MAANVGSRLRWLRSPPATCPTSRPPCHRRWSQYHPASRQWHHQQAANRDSMMGPPSAPTAAPSLAPAKPPASVPTHRNNPVPFLRGWWRSWRYQGLIRGRANGQCAQSAAALPSQPPTAPKRHPHGSCRPLATRERTADQIDQQIRQGAGTRPVGHEHPGCAPAAAPPVSTLARCPAGRPGMPAALPDRPAMSVPRGQIKRTRARCSRQHGRL